MEHFIRRGASIHGDARRTADPPISFLYSADRCTQTEQPTSEIKIFQKKNLEACKFHRWTNIKLDSDNNEELRG